jgi:CDP-6-deoxy-D-xylo-4-hexulose-3-dehydrase
MLGSFGDVSFTSFHAAHIVSMGVGGGVYTNDKALATRVRMYRDWGRQANIDQPHTCKTLPKDYDPRFVYEKIGYNFQVLELQAVMGRIQLKKANKIKALRKKNFDFLYKELGKYPDIILPKWLPNADVCWFAFPFSIVGKQRGKLVKHLNEHGIETRSMFAGNILRHPAYKKVEAFVGGELDGLNFIIENSLWIGVHPRMDNADRRHIIEVFDSYFNKNEKNSTHTRKVCNS